MKKKYNIFILPLIVVSFFIALLLVSCFKELSNDDVDCSTYDYSDCNTIEPDKAKKICPELSKIATAIGKS